MSLKLLFVTRVAHDGPGALFMLISTQNIQKITKNWQKLGNKVEDGRRFKAQKREKSSKKVWGKRKCVQNKKLIGRPCKSNIKIVVEEHVSPENMHSVLILLSMLKYSYHQPLFSKPSSKLKLFEKYFNQKYLSWMTQ